MTTTVFEGKASDHSFRAPWCPFRRGVDVFPFTDSELDGQARALWDEVERRRAHVEAVKQAHKDAEQAAAEADLTYRAELQRAADAGEVSTQDVELKRTAESAIAYARDSVHQTRFNAARDLAMEAENRYRNWLDENWRALLDELREPGEAVAAKVRKLHDEYQAKLQPLVLEHEQLRAAASLLVGNTAPFTSDDIPTDSSRAPLPTSESIARYDELHGPPPAPRTDIQVLPVSVERETV